jgi:hypothetical protein
MSSSTRIGIIQDVMREGKERWKKKVPDFLLARNLIDNLIGSLNANSRENQTEKERGSSLSYSYRIL